MIDLESKRQEILSKLLDDDLRASFTVEEACALQILRNSKAQNTEKKDATQKKLPRK